MKSGRTYLLMMSLYLVLSFGWRLISPSYEVDSPGLKMLTIALNVGMLVGIAGFAIQIVKESQQGEGGAGGWVFLSILGFIAGLGLLFTTLSGPPERKLSRSPSRSATVAPSIAPSTTSSITPPPPPFFSPRPTATPTPDPANKVMIEARLQFYELHAGLMNMTHWMKVRRNPNQYKQVTSEDLHDFDEKARDVLVEIDKMLALLPASDQETWRVRRDLITACAEQARLFEANWKEWHATGIKPKKGDPKPWQPEAVRLQSEIDAIEKRDTELTQKAK